MSYLLSVVIPTRNRQSYLMSTLMQVLENTNEKVEIIVQDNSDNNNLEKEIKMIDQSRVKYNYQREQLSFVDNFSVAVSLTSGKYIIIIGDDDGVLPEIVQFTELAEKNNIDILVPKITFEYFWPNSVEINKRTDGVMRFLDTKYSMKQVDGRKEIIKLLKKGGMDYTYLNTAKIYHGIVRRDCLDKIQKETGSVFGGLTPDIYMAVCLSLISNSIYLLSIPLTIAGICPASGSAQASNGIHEGRYEDAPHLIGHKDYSWSPLIPKFYCVETIWADSAIAAISNLKRNDLLKYFSIEAITGRLLYKYNKYNEIITNNYYNNTKAYSSISRAGSLIDIKTKRISDLVNRIIRRIKRMNTRVIYQYGIEDISKATLTYENMNSKKIVNMKGKKDV